MRGSPVAAGAFVLPAFVVPAFVLPAFVVPAFVVLATLVGMAPSAAARSRTRLFHRVNLHTSASVKLMEVDVGHREPRTKKAATANWWRLSAGGRRPEIRVELDEAFDSGSSDPATAFRAQSLIVTADEKERLRLPSPDKSGRVLWYALEGDILVVAWSATDELRLGIDLRKSKVIWRRSPLENRQSSPNAAASAHAAGGGRILIHDKHAFEAISAESGATLWRQSRGIDDHDSSVEICQLSPARWVVATDQVAAFDAASGTVTWRSLLGPGLPRWCLVQSDRVIVAWRTGIGRGSERDALVALDASDGRVIWRHELDEMIYAGKAVDDGSVAIWTEDAFARLDGSSGQTLWKTSATDMTSIEVPANGDWFLPDAECARLDASTGALRWKLGVRCRRQGERVLLTAATDRRALHEATVWLRRYSFDDQKLFRESVVHRYRQFFDTGEAQVVDVMRDAAVVESGFIVLE